MQFSGTEEIAAPRDKVWAFLIDPNQVGSCGPGVQSIEVVDDDHFNARAKVGVGFITATFNVHMTFVERIPGERAKIEARGQAPGSAVDAVGEMHLADGANGGTTMNWSANVNISGTLASVGARLIEGTAKKLIGQTFTCIKTKVEAPVAP
jgi:carbon monoxide dehydrogenase subunit G